MSRRRAFAICLASCLLLGGCEPEPAAHRSASRNRAAWKRARVELAFGAFSATREVFDAQLMPDFAKLRRQQGQQITFTKVYAGSEVLTDTIASGFAADVALFAHSRDIESLVAAGLVRETWRDAPKGGIVCRSIVVLAVRKGNPKAIRDWSDLSRPGLAIVTPDPGSSGGGIWNLCAVYGAALRGHAGVAAEDLAAREFLTRVEANVVERRASASDSFRAFLAGTGDVAITYESEVALAWLFGHEVERVVPSSTVLVESPAALIDRNVDAHGVRAEAQAFFEYLWTTEAQKKLAYCGFRPVDDAVAAANRSQFPQPKDLWTIEYLGGWDDAVRAVRASPPAQPPK
ncbi:MAG TPA: sulfate ABC transporter substrate-binding protein [Planctomycetota bacterium]